MIEFKLRLWDDGTWWVFENGRYIGAGPFNDLDNAVDHIKMKMSHKCNIPVFPDGSEAC